jgi:DNA-binding transcriptional ArsR family regulator
MAAREQQLINEPERIRALSHPLRLRLLDLLGERGELTATQCAELTGESVASCSFHLRMLEKYGFIERAESRGREKPWKPVSRGGYATEIDPGEPGSVLATVALARMTFQQRAEGLWAAVERLAEEPPEWLNATRLMNGSFWATAAEAAEIADQINELLTRYEGRDDPDQRPEGVRRVRLMTTIHSDAPAPTDV